MSDHWYCKVMGEEIGPLSAQQLRQMARQKKITGSDFVRKGEEGRWVYAGRVRGLFEPGNSAPTPPPKSATPAKSVKPTKSVEHVNVQQVQRPQAPTTIANTSQRRTKICPDCHHIVSRSVRTCPHCGRKLKASLLLKIMLVPIFAIVILSFVGRISSILFSHTTSHERSTGRNIPTISEDTWGAVNEELFERMQNLAIAGDQAGIQELMNAGLIAPVSAGTRIRVIDRGFLTTEVRIESGPYSGVHLIVPTDKIDR